MKTEQEKPLGNVPDERKSQRGESPETDVTRAPLQLKTILVPVDFSACSEEALEYALAFAARFQAGVVLLHVVESVVYPENYLNLPTVNDDVQASLIQAAKARLEEQARRLEASRIPVRSMTRLGRPFAEIADAAKESAADLIILGTHGYTGLKHVLLGSTAERVVRHAPCPVLTVRAPEHES